MYQVLARKWRPKNFHELVGQKHVTQALTYALDNNRLHHAYLFTGTRGVGKTTIARIFAKSLNCQTNGVSSTPCGECSNCQEIDQGRFPDLIEVDAASRTGVDDTRDLLDNVPYAPVKGRYKVYLIDEVHMFSRSSFNALLKTLEEPPEHVKFILATTDPQKMPATVLSRCLQFHLKNMTTTQIRSHLQHILEHDNIAYEQDALKLLAEAGAGSMRDSLSLLDQAIAYGHGAVNSEDVGQLLGAVPEQQLRAIMHSLADAKPSALREVLHALDAYSPDYQDLLKRLLYQLQEVTIVQLDAERFSGEIAEDMKLFADRLPVELVQLWYQIATDGWQTLAYQPDIRLAVEMILLRMIALRPILPTADPSKLRDIPPASPTSPEEEISSLVELQAKIHEEQSHENVANSTAEIAQQEHHLRLLQELPEEKLVQESASEDDISPPWLAENHDVNTSALIDEKTESALRNSDNDEAITTISEVVQRRSQQTAAHNSKSESESTNSNAKLTHDEHGPNVDSVQSVGLDTAVEKAHDEEEHGQLSSTNLDGEANKTPANKISAHQHTSVNLDACRADPLEWARLVNMLDLPDIPAVVVENSELLDWQPPNLTLGVGEHTMAMCAHHDVAAVISSALSAALTAPCRVKLEVANVVQTPASIAQRTLDERQQEAERSILSHPMVKKLQQSLGATIIPGSILPLETK